MWLPGNRPSKETRVVAGRPFSQLLVVPFVKMILEVPFNLKDQHQVPKSNIRKKATAFSSMARVMLHSGDLRSHDMSKAARVCSSDHVKVSPVDPNISLTG